MTVVSHANPMPVGRAVGPNAVTIEGRRLFYVSDTVAISVVTLTRG